MRLKKNFSLKSLTTTKFNWRAKYFLSVAREAELIKVITWAEQERLHWSVIGDGSNVIPTKGVFNGLIIKNKINEFVVKDKLVYLGAGNNLLRSILQINSLGLAGLEKMAGIPGTVGGAIYGCAGAYGQEIKDCLQRVKIIKQGKAVWLSKSLCGFGYRESVFKKQRDWIIVGAEFKFTKSNPAVLQTEAKAIIKIRNKKYPKNLKCPGSFFKNIVVDAIKPVSLKKNLLAQIDESKVIHGKIPVAYFLEQVGAKNLSRGGVAVAGYHANLVYNKNCGNRGDLERLVKILKNRVKKRFGLALQEEVQYY